MVLPLLLYFYRTAAQSGNEKDQLAAGTLLPPLAGGLENHRQMYPIAVISVTATF